MKKIFIASKNRGKIREIKSVLGNSGIEFLSLYDKPEIPDIAETGSTFRDNALLKAKAVYDIVKIPVIADDSGLEVDYLKGAPGVHSARYAGENASDLQNCEKLLKEMDMTGFPLRTARFKCVIILYDGKEENCFEGECEGYIITELRGKDGFGYDPLFMPAGYAKTFSELEPAVKNDISHRGIALKKLMRFINSELKK